MELVVEERVFDDLQNFLVGEIVAAVHEELMPLHLPRQQLQDVLNAIAFHVCCAVDGSTIMEHQGKRVIPVLTFAETADMARVVSCGSSSYMHEYVHGTTDALLEQG